MAINKRTRFEVLRRDKFRCYYCGARGNETTGDGLTIDHVIPVALGGSDAATNLVAACGDCNAGKTSTAPDGETVDDLNIDVEQYKAARKLALDALEADIEARDAYVDQIWEEWDHIFPEHARDNRDVESVATSWFRNGVPVAIAAEAMNVAQRSRAPRGTKMRYAAGVVKNLMADAEDRTRALVAGDEVVYGAGYDAGFNDGQGFEKARSDLLRMHIDGERGGLYAVMTEDQYIPWKRRA
ncbi:HNH endonuclease [Microbacterium schleiferi]|uniref:HNH endonuclease n=1 Tax=Microbacterium schleiferi TaxID=69362 RepID=UPI001D172395|nr:HNH endonuclease [Microbacterium schleiferi]MCC4266271.1 HNH endonuclease [Microbacterium schleiferi]